MMMSKVWQILEHIDVVNSSKLPLDKAAFK